MLNLSVYNASLKLTCRDSSRDVWRVVKDVVFNCCAIMKPQFMKPFDNQPVLVRLNFVLLKLKLVLIYIIILYLLTVFLEIDPDNPCCLICHNEDTVTCMKRITVTHGMTR